VQSAWITHFTPTSAAWQIMGIRQIRLILRIRQIRAESPTLPTAA